jgi:hypothetical protein
MAMRLAERVGAAPVFVRMAHWPIAAVAERLGEEKGIVFVNLQELVMLGIRRLPGLLGRGMNPSHEDELLNSSPTVPVVRKAGEEQK